jgi:acyl carrier protein
VAGVWRSVLGVADLDLDRSFFELGGTSLALLKVHHLLGQRLGRELSLVDLFRYPTVRRLAGALVDVPAGPAAEPRGRRYRDVDRIRMARARGRDLARRAGDETR